MKRYVGTKTLTARPMTRGEYNEYRDWNIPAGENPADPGYLVEYEDGGKANDSRHAGYISWSPADVFEKTYREVSGDYRDRVRAERARLAEDLEKLTAFTGTATFAAMDLDDRLPMFDQKDAMSDYLTTLDNRIARFPA